MRLIACLLLSPLSILLAEENVLSQAGTALQQGEYETAIRLFQLHLEKQPGSYDARFGLARALAFSGQRAESIRVFSELIRDHPGDPDAHLGRGRVYSWEKQYPEAEADFQLVTQRYPRYADAFSALGDLYLWSDRIPLAIEAYTKRIELQPENPESYRARARAYQSARNFALAREDLYTALAKGGDAEDIARSLRTMDRIPGALPWQASFSYSFDGFSDETFDAHTLKTSIRREFETGSLGLEGIRAYRFSQWDDAIAVDGFLDLWRRAYGNLRVQAGIDTDVLPHWASLAEIFQGFGKGWEASAGARFLDFGSTDVDFYAASIAKYLDNWFFREQVTFVPKEKSVKISNSLLARRYLTTVDDFVQAAIGFASDGTHSYSMGIQKFFHPQFGIFLAGNFNDSDDPGTRGGFTIEFITRW